MLTLEFSTGDMARIRFALSCLWEVASSYHVLQAPENYTIQRPWVDQVHARVRAAGLGPGSLLSALIPPGPRYMPDFLTPPSATLNPSLADELQVVLATPHEVVRTELNLIEWPRNAAVQALYDDPATGLRRLADEITAYWDIALAEHWPRMKALLEAEVFHRARLLAEEGAVGLLNGLHDAIGWQDDTLSIAHKMCGDEVPLSGNGLLIVPAIFVWPAVRTVTSPENPQLAYPARGIATLWESAAPAPAALAAVIGRSRAQLLVELAAPLSTTDLARRTGMSAGGVSQHLSALRAAGLITAHRAGHAVLNMRTPAADTLLAAGVA
ncbi:MAG: winged helix-turn-helix transcriptional regulator [Hamadaea sp.]|nr:winged helix-turn-helix transcriptional regulator [Hamadaea sp.]NUR49300.1 winged helix-turn-helix transcriptional regulator [Hamadaea sp.]NUT06407.1 winged helix-turn-helix transcriptional regulator [Hamadaea sp.]